MQQAPVPGASFVEKPARINRGAGRKATRLQAGANTHSNWSHHGKENRWFYQAASAGW
jgi:hypothetical protein